MIYAPRGWTRRSTADGIVLFPPDGPDAGHLIYRERVRPLAPVLEIFRRQLAAADAVDGTPLRPRFVITNEGEYAAVATVRSQSGAVQHDLGVVLLDDFYALLHNVTRDPSRFAVSSTTFLELVLHDMHQLGDRRRRYLYTEPATWQGRPRGLETDYFPLDYPQQDLTITVLPALPKQTGATSVKYLESVLTWQREQAPVEDVGGPLTVQTQYMSGSELKWNAPRDGKKVSRRAAVLEDERFLYPVFLEGVGELAAARENFVGIIHSIEPIPFARGVTAAPQSAVVLSMWEI